MKLRAFFLLHLSVLLFSFTAILGDIIQLSTISLVWWRVLLTAFALFFILNPFRVYKNIPKRLFWQHVFVGLLVAVHWLAFYGSIKVSNASIVLITMSTTSFITALVEPLMIRESKWRRFDLVMSILVVPAMMLIYYEASEVQQLGLWIGLIASAVGAIFSILNKKWLSDNKEYEIILVQQSTVWLVLSLLLIVYVIGGTNYFEIPKGIDWFYLVIFAVVCTVIPYFLYLRSMKWLSAFDVSFAFNMEPVYGLAMAAFILLDHQELSLNIYLGILFILLMVSLQTYLKSRNDRKSKQKHKAS